MKIHNRSPRQGEMDAIESVLTSVNEKAEAFVQGNPKFLSSTTAIFEGLERNGKISHDDASRAVAILFDLLAGQLDGLGIPVNRPTREEVNRLLQAVHADQASGLNERQFRVRT